MVDDLRSDGHNGVDGHSRRGSRAERGPRRLADREVPLVPQDQEQRMLSSSVHAWLDGDLPEATVRKGDTGKDVEFWNRLTEQAERRRRMRTPAELQLRIMEALPHNVPQVITPWYKREFVVTPGAALTAAVVLVSLTVVVTSLLLAAF